MQCLDLERYLEAFLDGRLGRSRGAVLRRHLLLCGACRAKVERLRQFERDLQRRFRSMEPARSLWQGLELNLLASTRAGGSHGLIDLPPLPAPPERTKAAGRAQAEPGRKAVASPRTRARGLASRLVGGLFLALALGTVVEAVRLYLPGQERDDAVGEAYRQFARGEQPLAVRSEDAGRLREWLSTALGTPVPAPPAPAGFRLVGADQMALPDGEAGVVVYEDAAAAPSWPVVLFLSPLAPPAASPTGPAASAPIRPAAHDAASDLRRLAWESDGFRFTLVGQQPEEALRPFVD